MKKTGIYRIIALTAAIIMLCASFSACKKHDKNALTKEQQVLLTEAAEAFYEYGSSYSSADMLPMDKAEMFIYYYFNDKLEAAEGGYGQLPKAKAGEFLKTFFGMDREILPRQHSADGERLLYCSGSDYYIKIAPAAAECAVKNVTLRDDGKYEGCVTCTGENGAIAELTLIFNFTDAGIRIFECKRLDAA